MMEIIEGFWDRHWRLILAVLAIIAAVIIAANIIVVARRSSATVAPAFTFEADIVDGETGQPVRAVVKVNGEVVLRDADHFSVAFPLDARGFVMITVEAPGYKVWSLGFRGRIPAGRILYAPVRLQPE